MFSSQLSNNGITGDKDFYDGLLDITHAADFITVSYTKFHDHVSHDRPSLMTKCIS